jgi:hypothetical protein
MDFRFQTLIIMLHAHKWAAEQFQVPILYLVQPTTDHDVTEGLGFYLRRRLY